jgi:hypothetical protein
MARFDLGGSFGLAIIAYRAFQHLLTPKEQRSCLQRVHRHLRRRGRLTQQAVHVEVKDRRTGPVSQSFSETWRWTVTRNGSIVQTYEDVLRLRGTYRYEMRYLLELTGFQVRAECSDFKGSPPRYGAERVWVAETV